jgi:hypothetical protein
MLLGFQIKDFSTQTGELIQQRLLDMLPLVEADLCGCVLGAHEGVLETERFGFRFAK